MDTLHYDLLTDHWLSLDLDAWTRQVIRRHFDPVLGSPYWLKRATELDFNPLDITRYDELTAFGPFPPELMRTLDPTAMVPLSVPRPLTGRIWETGGTTGNPWRVFYTEQMLLHRGVWRRWSWATEGFEPHRSWLHATPTGPHTVGNIPRELVDFFGAMVYVIDMDPRWVKRLVRSNRLSDMNEYTEHLLDQIIDIFKQRVHYMHITPPLFDALLRKRPDLVSELQGIRLLGTQITPGMYREFARAMNGGIVGRTYGNTLGVAAGLPAENGGDLLPYVPNFPHVTMTVVDKKDWTTAVNYGETGQVRLTVLQEDLFMPNVLERDQAIRHDLGGRWPCDGVANVRPLEVTSAKPEGLY
jgi:hypothetical protein